MQPTIWGDDYGRRKGDRLLAAKAPLLFGEPSRWGITVFKYPLFRPTNFIKRLVGLPGEHLQIKGGDIYVNGKCVAKPEPVQDTLWFPLFPDESRSYSGGASRQFVSDGTGEWKFDANDSATGTARASHTAWAIYDSSCPDVRVSFDLDASALTSHEDTTPYPGSALVRIDGGGRRVELEVGRDDVWLTAPGVARRKLDADGYASSGRIGFAVADRVVRVWRGGRLVERIETADEENVSGGRQQQVWIGVSGGTAKFGSIQVERDLQYGEVAPNDWQIPEGCYFMLGDNTNASRDSRLWRASVFRTTDGREYVADDSVRLDDERAVNNIKNLGDAYEFWDSYGVKRHLRTDELEGGGPKVEPRPFVLRDDLVGRAFLIFFPFPPFGEWRPRILP
jgi:signal peptidase I